MTSLDAYMASRPDRCACGYHAERQGCRCDGSAGKAAALDAAAADEWAIFRAALVEATDAAGEIDQTAMRRLTRGRIYHKRIGRFYKRAKDEGLIVAVRREQSTDEAGRNSHHSATVYRRAAA